MRKPCAVSGKRTQEWKSIDQAVAALLPFVDKTAAANAGFDTSRAFPFNPFTPAPSPNPLGEFIGFHGSIWVITDPCTIIP